MINCVQLSARCLSKIPAVSSSLRLLHTSYPVTSKRITVFSDLKGLTSTPTPALSLGLAGLLPFVSAPVYMYNSGFFLPEVATAQLTYGATILSFLGGVRWGLLVHGSPSLPPSWSQYSWSVTPSLIAWVALLIPNFIVSCSLCSAGLLAALILDLQQQGYPGWFRGLRFILSLGAILSLLATMFLTQTLGVKKQASDYLT